MKGLQTLRLLLAVLLVSALSFQYWQQVGKPQKSRFVSLTDAYHGETLGALSVGGCDLYLYDAARPAGDPDPSR